MEVAGTAIVRAIIAGELTATASPGVVLGTSVTNPHLCNTPRTYNLHTPCGPAWGCFSVEINFVNAL